MSKRTPNQEPPRSGKVGASRRPRASFIGIVEPGHRYLVALSDEGSKKDEVNASTASEREVSEG